MNVIAELEDDHQIYLESEWRWRDIIKTIPGTRWDDKRQQWKLPISWSACLALRSSFKDQLEIGPRLAEWATFERETRIDPCMFLRTQLDAPGDPALFGWQRSGAKFIAAGKQVLIGDEMGCIAGDTELIVNRAGKACRMTMRELHHRWQGGASKDRWGNSRYIWDRAYPTRIKSQFDDGFLRLNSIVETFHRGDQKVIKITTAAGRVIRCTRDHNISTGIGLWSEAGSLKVGDQISINGIATCKRCESTNDVIETPTAKWVGYCRKCMYRYLRKDKWNDTPDSRAHRDQRHGVGDYYMRNKQWEHPNADKYGKIPEHIFVASQALDRSINTAAGEVVHHLDGDPSNNDPSNLKVLTRQEHGREHGVDGGFMHLHGGSGRRGEIWFKAHLDSIVSIVDDGVADVYDIEMTAPAHNFVAAGVVVHNSGKTATTIRGIAELYRNGNNVFPILVVCPNSVKNSWKREFEMWWPGLEVQVIKGSMGIRRKQLKEAAHVYVLNYEALRSHSRLAPYGSVSLKKCLDHGGEDPKITENTCQVHLRELNKFKFQTVIADECHRVKDSKSQQTRALWAAAGDAEFRIALSGTPIANDVTDLWPILHFLKPSEFSSKTRWIDRYLNSLVNAYNQTVILGIKPEMYDEFYKTLEPRFRRMPEELILAHLPPIIYERIDCEMSAKQKKAYDQMKNEMIAELEDSETLRVGRGGPMTRATRLLQFASSYAEAETIDDGVDEHGFPKSHQKVTLIDPSAKLDTFMEMLPDFGDNHVAVMAVSRQLIELLSARLEKAKIPHGLVTGRQSEDERTRHIDDFQAGKTKFILFTAGAGGTGITLTNARILVRLQRPYSLVDDRQALKRVKRIGSEKHENILVLDFVTAGTIDTEVKKALDKKSVSFEEVVRDEKMLLELLKNGDDE